MSTIEPTPDEIERLYIDEDMTRQEVADELGKKKGWVKWQLQEHDIRKMQKARPWQDEDTLREMYLEKGMGQPDIAEELGCTKMTVSNWMREYGITRRSQTKRQSLGWGGDGTGTNYGTGHKGHTYWSVNVEEEDGWKNYKVGIHRLIAVAEHGFDALKDKHVHHINHIPWDNRPDNLEVLSGKEHMTYHARVREGIDKAPWAVKSITED
jgi:DNA-binding XRE family transcriptional regulator